MISHDEVFTKTIKSFSTNTKRFYVTNQIHKTYLKMQWHTLSRTGKDVHGQTFHRKSRFYFYKYFQTYYFLYNKLATSLLISSSSLRLTFLFVCTSTYRQSFHPLVEWTTTSTKVLAPPNMIFLHILFTFRHYDFVFGDMVQKLKIYQLRSKKLIVI